MEIGNDQNASFVHMHVWAEPALPLGPLGSRSTEGYYYVGTA